MPKDVEPTAIEETPSIEEVPSIDEESIPETQEVTTQETVDEMIKEEEVEETVAEEVIEKEEPPTVEEEPSTEEVENEVIAEFGEVKITKQDYHDTMDEIKVVVDALNKVARTSDYVKWLTFLSESYRIEFSKPSTLKATIENLKKKTGIGIQLTTLRDYFKYVFVPARQNIKVDDIEFLSPQRVNVLMFSKGHKLLIYDLEKIQGRWLLLPRR